MVACVTSRQLPWLDIQVADFSVGTDLILEVLTAAVIFTTAADLDYAFCLLNQLR